MPCPFHDPFKEARDQDGVLINRIQGEDIPIVLRHADVRKAAKDWRTFSSDAPHRVPIPSEEELRPMRQLPIETNPPEHTEYRKIVEPFFKRAKRADVIAKVERLVDRLLTHALSQDTIEAVRDLTLPLQSTALTYLLNVDESEAKTWISWGTHSAAEAHPCRRFNKSVPKSTVPINQLKLANRIPTKSIPPILSQITFA